MDLADIFELLPRESCLKIVGEIASNIEPMSILDKTSVLKAIPADFAHLVRIVDADLKAAFYNQDWVSSDWVSSVFVDVFFRRSTADYRFSVECIEQVSKSANFELMANDVKRQGKDLFAELMKHTELSLFL
jgi:hypothetical protein